MIEKNFTRLTSSPREGYSPDLMELWVREGLLKVTWGRVLRNG